MELIKRRFKHKVTGLHVIRCDDGYYHSFVTERIVDRQEGGQMIIPAIVEKGQDWEEVFPKKEYPDGTMIRHKHNSAKYVKITGGWAWFIDISQDILDKEYEIIKQP